MDLKTDINKDLNFLAGSHITRGFGTEGEVLAGIYIKNRLQEFNLPSLVESFPCSKETFQIFSLYYIEFFFVLVFTFLLPIVGATYGIIVTFFYLFEIFGFVSLSKFLSDSRSQNIYTLIKNKNKVESPKILVIHAYYDAGISHPLYSPKIAKVFSLLQDITLFSMLSIIVTGFWAGLNGINPIEDKVIRIILGLPGSYLCSYGLITLFCSTGGEATRGANFNASGVAGALSLTKYFSENPLKSTDVLIIFSGAHESWMAGLRHFLKKSGLPKERTLFINLEGIGCGKIHIVCKEHFILSFSTSKRVRKYLESLTKNLEIPEAKSLPHPTSSLIILANGYDSLTITGLDKEGMPSFKNQLEDKILNIDEENIQRVVEFVKLFAEEWSR
ncbi:MAG: M28 family peptidase [Candidatus Hydrogenedentes bacterium]|nr:M28 family peptidase [Candidatus Hydrogenedentota bacterium]